MPPPPHRAHHAWDHSPGGLLTLRSDGTVLEANRTFLDWVDRGREEVVGRLRLSELLSVGGRIYWETHLAPLLQVEGGIEEVALELRTPQGRRPVLMTAVTRPSPDDGQPDVVHVVLSSAQERSRYERELLAARRAAESASERTQVLLGTTSALSQAVGLRGVVDALLEAATGPFGAASATFWGLDADGVLQPHASVGEEVTASPNPWTVPGARRRAAVAHGDRVLVPLHGQTTLQGILSLVPCTDPTAGSMDLSALTALGQQAGLALDRARLYEESTSVAHELQQSLLASEHLVDERFTVTTAYRPGVESLEVGGDWYDAFISEPDVLAVAVGDVVGRGLRAASAMGQLRSAIRAIAGPGVGPAALVSRLDRFVEHVEAAATATLAYGQVDLTSGRVRYSCAGHLPPLLLPADGEPHLVWDGRSTPLGAVVPGMDRPEAELVLRPGDQVLLYTDGLIERRGQSITEGFDALIAAAADLRGQPPAAAVQALTARLLLNEKGRDDVCVLLLGWAGDRAAARPVRRHGLD